MFYSFYSFLFYGFIVGLVPCLPQPLSKVFMAEGWLSDKSISLWRGLNLRCKHWLGFSQANKMQGFHVKVTSWPIEGGVVNGSMAKDRG